MIVRAAACTGMIAILIFSAGCHTPPAKTAEGELEKQIQQCAIHFNQAHTLMKKADWLKRSGMLRQAVTEYRLALDYLEKARTASPSWNKDSMDTLMQSCRGELTALGEVVRLRDLRESEAIAGFVARRAADPTSGAPFANLGNFYFGEGEYARALTQYIESLTREPGNLEVQMNLARIYSRTGNLEKAKRAYGRIIAANPDLAVVHYNLGGIYFRQKKPTYAMREYTRALELQPDYADAYNALGVLNKQLRHYDQAIAYFQSAIAFAPDHAAAHENMGLTFMEKNNYPTAINYLQRAIELFGPESPRGIAIADGLKHMHRYR